MMISLVFLDEQITVMSIRQMFVSYDGRRSLHNFCRII